MSDRTGTGEKFVAYLEKLGIVGAYNLVKRHRDEASDSLESSPVTEALIQTMLDMATLFQQEHPVKETLEHLVIHCLCLGYRIGVEQTEADHAGPR